MSRIRTIGRLRAGGGGAAAAYTTQGRDFDGTNDYATRGADLTGAADSGSGLLSLWFRKDGGDGSAQAIFDNGSSGATRTFYMQLQADNSILIGGERASDQAPVMQAESIAAYTAGATWRHVLAAWNLATSVVQLYISDADALDTATDVATASETVDLTRGNFAIGGSTLGSLLFNGCLSEFWFNTEYLDISVEANRRKFIKATGKPEDLNETNGSRPTGNQPLIYLPHGNPADNKGTGGNFTVTGALDVSSTSPSD